jgi:exodeoxyribonuclease VII large subunit
VGGALETLSPLAILQRGYALVFDESGKLVKDAGKVKAGEEISARLARGEIRATVKPATAKGEAGGRRKKR